MLAFGEFQEVSRGQFSDVPESGERVGDIAKMEKLDQRFVVEFCEFRRDGKYGLDFRPEIQPALMESIVERLFSQAVTRQQQATLALVIQSDGKHAAQLVDAFPTQLLVEVHNHFGIRVGVEPMSLAF